MTAERSPPDPPETRRETVVEELHGHAVEDPYRWLESDGEAVADWTATQNDYADAFLREGPAPVAPGRPPAAAEARETLAPAVESLAEVTEYGPIVVRGGRRFQRVEPAGADHPTLTVREGPDAERRTLVDPDRWPENADDGGPTLSMGWFRPAPAGDAVACGVTEGGDEQYDVRVIGVPDGERLATLPDRGRVNAGALAWDADGDGFHYVATGAASEGRQTEKELRHHDLTAGAERTLLEHDDEHVWLGLTADHESGTVAVAYSEMVGGTDLSVLVDGELRPVVAGGGADLVPTFREGRLFLRTDHEAPRGRVLACSVERFREGGLEPGDCEEVLPERDATLASVAATPEHLVAHYQADAHSSLSVSDHDGEHVRTVAPSGYVTVSALTADPDADRAFYAVESFDRPPTVERLRPATGDRRTLDAVDVAVPEDLVVRQVFVDSTDGAAVPVFLCYRTGEGGQSGAGGADGGPAGVGDGSGPTGAADGDDEAGDGAGRAGDVAGDTGDGADGAGDAVRVDGRPALLYGYGGFRNSLTPRFGRFRVPFLADGGVYAQVCARGGLEYGERWHEAGMLADKQHTFDDFVAAGEYLAGPGPAAPDRVAVAGGSNGGLSVGAALTQRPDLWAGAVSAVPLLDMLRFHRFLLGESWTTEYGSPEDPEAFEYLRAYSPYHSVAAGTEYPPTLFRTAAGDTRVHPAHARKMTARLQAEGAGGPVLLRTETDTGHGVGKPTSMVVAETLDRWAFLYDCLGVGSSEDGV